MPTYQYACTACGHQLEAVQSFADEPLTECPSCEGRLRKVFNSVGIVFKGSGFYRTDSRAKNGAEKSSSAGPGADSAGKNGSKDSNGSTGAAGKGDSSSGSSGSSSSPASTSGSSSGGSATKPAAASNSTGS
ncbi:FmdB family zinc ribbon protein [Plantactinospora sp. GCM10030261]|uniref:FmdB family zinc ribbon protein n=1 Tax=Plantactinospora sp. GCM10030261 TaxID=3273420 RepID=UPI0036151294